MVSHLCWSRRLSRSWICLQTLIYEILKGEFPSGNHYLTTGFCKHYRTPLKDTNHGKNLPHLPPSCHTGFLFSSPLLSKTWFLCVAGMALHSPSSCLHALNAGATGTHCHALINEVLNVSNVQLYSACQVITWLGERGQTDRRNNCSFLFALL